MHKHYETIANGLYKISTERRQVEAPEAYLICLMMGQIGHFLNSSLKEKREDAMLYFNSEDFKKHCKVLALHEHTVRKMLTMPIK